MQTSVALLALRLRRSVYLSLVSEDLSHSFLHIIAKIKLKNHDKNSQKIHQYNSQNLQFGLLWFQVFWRCTQ